MQTKNIKIEPMSSIEKCKVARDNLETAKIEEKKSARKWQGINKQRTELIKSQWELLEMNRAGDLSDESYKARYKKIDERITELREDENKYYDENKGWVDKIFELSDDVHRYCAPRSSRPKSF